MKTKTRANAGERNETGSRPRARRSRGGQRGHDRPRSVTVATDRTTAQRSDDSTRREDAHRDDHPLVRLQRRHGNQAVQRFVEGVVQPTLRVGRPNDRYEKEADDVAARVTSGRPVGEVRHLDPEAIQRQPLEEREEELVVGATKTAVLDEKAGVGAAVKEGVKQEVKEAATEEVKKEAKPEVEEAAKPEVKKGATEGVKEEAAPEVEKEVKADLMRGVEKDPELVAADKPKTEEEKEELIQRKASTSTLDSGLGFPVSALLSGGGESLPLETRRFFEARFGRDFGGVRVHADGSADAAARALDAKAFTHGRDVYFRSGQYRPDNPEGRRLLAHELTHTVQQRPGETPLRKRQKGNVLKGQNSP